MRAAPEAFEMHLDTPEPFDAYLDRMAKSGLFP